MTTRTPAPVAVPISVPVTTGPLDRAPAPVSPATDPELPRTPVPVVRPATVAPAPAPTPFRTGAVPAVTLPVEEQPVDITPEPEDPDRNIVPANTPRFVTVLADGTVVVAEAAQLNFSGAGVSVIAQGSTANIVITGGAGSTYTNANVAVFMAAFGSNSVVTTGTVTAGNFVGNGSQLTGIVSSYGNVNVAATLAAFGSNSVVTTGNVSAGFFVGNGSALTGIVSSYGNANVTTFLPTYTGALAALTGNVTTTASIAADFFVGNGSLLTGIVSSYGNANVAANLAAFGSNPILTTGNISAGTVILANGARIRDTAGNAVSIGVQAGQTSQGNRAVAIGLQAGETSQGVGGIAIGELAGQISQGVLSVAIGYLAGSNAQSFSAVAIGAQAGETAQGSGAIAIGDLAGRTGQASNSIIINATGANLNQTVANTFTVAPVRNDVANVGEVVFYNATSKEITYGNSISIAGNISAQAVVTNSISSDDSTVLTIQDGLNVDGDIESSGNIVLPTGSIGENNEDGNLRIITTGNLRGVATAAVEIVSAAGESEKTWAFATDGTLTAPGNITTPGGYLRLNDGLFTWGLEAGPDSLGAVDLTSATFDEAGNITAQYTVSVINDGRLLLPESSEANVAKLTSPPNNANVSLQLYSGNAVRIVSNSAGEPFVWTFGTTGTFTAPGNVTATGNISGDNINAGVSFGLPVYADATARDAAITSPTAGMMVYVTDSGMQVRGATSWNTVTGTGT